MKIPNSVRIGGIEYNIEYIPNLNDGATLAYGFIDYDNCCIQLSSTDGLAHEHRCVTLLHEILHGIRNHAGLNIDNEEEIVDMFARGLYQVLQDNGERLFDLKSGVNDGEMPV